MQRSRQSLETMAEGFLAAWNTHDVAATLSCYTEDVIYLDPNTRGPIAGREAFGRYLEQLFSQWNMHWRLRELFPLGDHEGAAVLWDATLASRDGGPQRLVHGMDLAIVRGDLISRNEVYFDRAALA